MRGTFEDVVKNLRRSTVQVRTRRNGGGSGVIWSQDGEIITNAHVVEGAGNSGAAEVELWDGRRVPATVLKRDRQRDLAVLKVEAPALPVATAGDSNSLRVGELVIAVGNPLGFTGAASTGVVHRLNWDEGPGRGFRDPWVVSHLRLFPGNSGGPLANARGEVVGINTMIAGGLAFAIPSRSVVDFVKASIQGGREAQPALGVVAQPIPLGRQHLGFVVLEVIPGSAADRASLLQGDILVGAGGRRFQSVQDLQRSIHSTGDGTLELQFRRGANGNIRTVAARIAPASLRAA